jgi:hypothetical protein
MLISSLEFAFAVCGRSLEESFFFPDFGKDVFGRSSLSYVNPCKPVVPAAFVDADFVNLF